jgi:hypothetical protein
MSGAPWGPAISKLVPGTGGGAACAIGVPPKSIAPVTIAAPTAPTAALRAESSDINICELFSTMSNRSKLKLHRPLKASWKCYADFEAIRKHSYST